VSHLAPSEVKPVCGAENTSFWWFTLHQGDWACGDAKSTSSMTSQGFTQLNLEAMGLATVGRLGSPAKRWEVETGVTHFRLRPASNHRSRIATRLLKRST